MNETELLKAFRKERSEEAFAELVRRYAGLVYSVATRRLANAVLAEDVTQIVFIRFAKAPPNVETHGELAAWLHRTTLNVAIDTWRSETRRRNREQQAVVMEPTTQSAWEDISPNLDEAVNQLNDEDRQAILLRFFGKKSMRDVGTVLGVSEAAAKMRVSRAVERLRTQLGVGGAACTAAVLGTLLVEHSVEAAPLPLVSRLAAMRLPKLAGAAAAGGLLLALLQISKFKLATGAAMLATIGIITAHLFHLSNAPVPVAASQAFSDTGAMSGARVPRQMTPAGDSSSALAPKPPKILFHVLDAETGLGLPQAKIYFVYFGAGGQSENHETATDVEGNARLQEPDDPTKDSAPNVFVMAEGHVPKFVSPATNDYTVILDPAMTIGGLVVDEDGAPVPGVEIYFQYLGDRYSQPENVDFPNRPVSSDNDGGWTCSYIPKDYTNDIRLILKKPGYAVTFRSVPVPYKATFRPYIDMDNLVLVIDAGATVTGQVTDQLDRPIANARIKIPARSPSERQTVRTDRDGIFTLTGVVGEGAFSKSQEFHTLETNAAGKVLKIQRGDPSKIRERMKGIYLGPEEPPWLNVAVQADGFAPEMKMVKPVVAANFVNFKLTPGNYFRGRVVDDLGNPIPHVVVQTDFPYGGGNERVFDWIAHTDANGVFQWDSAPAEKTAYWFEADGYEVLRGMLFVADSTDHEITLKRKAAQ